MRFFTTVLGMVFVNTWRASQYFHGDQRALTPYLVHLFKQLMINTIDESNASAAPIGSGGPGAPSPDRLPKSPPNATAHRIVPMKAVGWKGAAQAKCAVCGTKTTACCIKCSSATVIVALCKKVHRYKGQLVTCGYAAIHARDPDASHRTASQKKAVQNTFAPHPLKPTPVGFPSFRDYM